MAVGDKKMKGVKTCRIGTLRDDHPGFVLNSVGYAQNGLTPRVTQAAERRLFEGTTAVELAAFDQDAFADDLERATRGPESAATLVQESANMFAGLVNLCAVAVAVINPWWPGRCAGAGCGCCTGRWPNGTRHQSCGCTSCVSSYWASSTGWCGSRPTWIVGENGSDKSTLAAMIAGLRTPTSGVIEWNGRTFADFDTDALRARMAVVVKADHRGQRLLP